MCTTHSVHVLSCILLYRRHDNSEGEEEKRSSKKHRKDKEKDKEKDRVSPGPEPSASPPPPEAMEEQPAVEVVDKPKRRHNSDSEEGQL